MPENGAIRLAVPSRLNEEKKISNANSYDFKKKKKRFQWKRL